MLGRTRDHPGGDKDQIDVVSTNTSFVCCLAAILIAGLRGVRWVFETAEGTFIQEFAAMGELAALFNVQTVRTRCLKRLPTCSGRQQLALCVHQMHLVQTASQWLPPVAGRKSLESP